MVHKLWNILEGKGYEVAGEAKVVPEERHQTMRDWTETFDEEANIMPKRKGASTKIDLVATDGERFTGYEVKDSFEAVGPSVANKGQLENYTYGNVR